MVVRQSQRPQILEAGLRVAGGAQGAAVTLDAVATEAGVTKPGLMYHFPTRDALMVALVEHAAAQVKRRVLELLGTGRSEVGDRYRAYIRVVAEGQNMRAEWALLYQSAFSPELQAAWARQLDPCLLIPEGMPLETRNRFITARLAADGLWAAQASGVLLPSEGDRTQIVAHMLSLIHEENEGETL